MDPLLKDNDSLRPTDSEITRILELDNLVSNILESANKPETNKYHRVKVFDIIAHLYSIMDKVIMNDMNHLLGRAYICLLENSTLKEANDSLTSMIKECLNYIPRETGRSRVEFHESQCKNELIEHRVVLRSRNKKIHNVRSSIAYCLLKLGKINEAQLEFELALRSNSKCVRALIGLAITRLIVKKPKESIVTLNLCVRFPKSCDLDSLKIETVNKIAFGYYIQENYSKAEQYSKFVTHKSKNADRLTESYHLLGKIYEITGDFQKTYSNYYKAVKCAQSDVLYPYYDLGLIYTLLSKDKKAERCFDHILSGGLECKKSKKLLASVFARSQNEKKKEIARIYLKEVIDESPKDLDAWSRLALLDIDNPTLLVPTYHEIVNLISSTPSTNPPIEALNTIAKIHFHYKRYDDACIILESSIKSLLKKSEISKCIHLEYLTNSTSILLAEVYKKQKQFEKAEQIYRKMSERDPTNTDAILPVPRSREEYIIETLVENPTISMALLLHTILGLNRNENNISVLNVSSPTDSDSSNDSKLALFNHAKKIALDIEINDLTLEMFNILTNTEPDVIWNSKGVGNSLARNNDMINDIKHVFAKSSKVNKLCNSWIMYADECSKVRKSYMAITILETCVKLFFIDHSFKALVLLGHEYLVVEKLQEARKVFLKAFRVFPHDVIIMQYLANTLQRLGCEMIREHEHTSEVESKALEYLNLSKKFNMFLLKQEITILHEPAKDNIRKCLIMINDVRLRNIANMP